MIKERDRQMRIKKMLKLYEEHKDNPDIKALARYAIDAQKEIISLEKWIGDLQSGMYVNCVYCGHQYGSKEDVPTSMADVLKEHIKQCPKHPLSAALKKIEELEKQLNVD